MTTFIETVARHSTRFRPAFTLFSGSLSSMPVRIDGVDLDLRSVRLRGREVTRLQPPDGETEIGRFAGLARVMTTTNPEGRPPKSSEAAISTQHEVCNGAAQLLITDRRLCALLIRGETILGKVNELHGSVLVLSFPYTDIDYVDISSKKGVLGGVRESDVKVMSLSPPAGFVLQPHYAFNGDAPPMKVTYSLFADTLVNAACDFLLGIVPDEAERERLRQIRAGQRHRDGMDLTAVIQMRDPTVPG